MNAMLLAAGMGRRLLPLTATRPKPLIEVGGRPLIDHHLRGLAEAGVKHVVINLHYLGEQIEAFVGSGEQWNLRVTFRRESELLDTGGAVENALGDLGNDPFMVISADIWSTFPLRDLLEYLPVGAEAGLVGVPLANHRESADLPLPERSGWGIPKPGKRSLTYAGIGVFRPQTIRAFSNDSSALTVDREASGTNNLATRTIRPWPLRDLFWHLLERDRLAVRVWEGSWEDIGDPSRLADLNRAISEGHR